MSDLTDLDLDAENAPRCPSCGKPWIEHMGCVGLCARVEALEARLATARAEFLKVWPDGVGCHHDHARAGFRALEP